MSDVPEFKFCLLSSLHEAVRDHLEGLTCFGKDDYVPTVNDFLPTRSEPLATGWDVRCADPKGIDLVCEGYVKIPLGIKVFSPSGWWLQLKPRSSTFAKRHIHSLYGTIDEAYEGQMFFCGQYIPDSHEIVNINSPKRIEFGDRIGQLIPVRREEMLVSSVTEEEFQKLSEDRNAERKAGGFGSTGSF